MKKHPLIILTVILIILVLISLVIGRYPMTLAEIGGALYAKLTGAELTHKQDEILFLLSEIRIPRIIAAIMVGAALSVSGTVYQAMFLNPLASPKMLGVLAGASFGAGLGIVIFNSWFLTQILAFAFACAAVAFAVFLANMFSRSSMVVLVLGGSVSWSLFMSLTWFLQYIADPDTQLPELVYWMMGTLARANNSMILKVGIVMSLGVLFLCTRGKTMNVLSLGDEEAQALGLPVRRMRLQLIALATFVSASTVLIAGTIDWIGLIVPHVLRFLIGPDNRVLVPAAALGGGAYLLFTDALVRSVFPVEIPVGIVTALFGVPLFVFAIYRNRGVWR